MMLEKIKYNCFGSLFYGHLKKKELQINKEDQGVKSLASKIDSQQFLEDKKANFSISLEKQKPVSVCQSIFKNESELAASGMEKVKIKRNHEDIGRCLNLLIDHAVSHAPLSDESRALMKSLMGRQFFSIEEGEIANNIVDLYGRLFIAKSLSLGGQNGSVELMKEIPKIIAKYNALEPSGRN